MMKRGPRKRIPTKSGITKAQVYASVNRSLNEARASNGKQPDLFPIEIEQTGGITLYDDLLDRALERGKRTRAGNTTKTYRTAFERWVEWCDAFGAVALPIDPLAFVSYLEWMAEQGYSRSTIKLRLTAASVIDRYSRTTPSDPYPSPITRHAAIERWQRAFRRDDPFMSTPAPYVTREQIAAILQRMLCRFDSPARRMHNARDRAVFLLGYLGAFRRNELSDLKVKQVVRSGRGIMLQWYRTKGDQEGIGEERLILPQEEVELCAVDAWDRWEALYRESPHYHSEAYAFPPLCGAMVKPKKWAATSIYQMVVAHGVAAGIPISPHSLRAAFATHSSMVHDESLVAYHGRWSTVETMKPYIRRSKTHGKKNATARLDPLERSMKEEG